MKTIDREKLLKDLSELPEMLPDEHDGTYELMREVVDAYSTITDFSICTIKDLNAIYLMTIGTWKLNAEKKKEYIKQGNLSQEQKDRIISVIDRIWDNACHNRYQNREGKKPSFGMFGTGFYSFEGKSTDKDAQAFIRMIVDIKDMTDDNAMFDRAELVFSDNFSGMRSASASVILHCLKPYTFPILNGNMDNGNIFDSLGVQLDHPERVDTYIPNCRKIKLFRDQNLPFKNYRILDQWVNKIGDYEMEIETNDIGDENMTFDKNMILYGPPGTGKTYHTVLYAVAIVEGKSLPEIQKEAQIDYSVVKSRYNDYIEAGNIAFTTFHQSYGYEEFIEGIRPSLNQNEESGESGEIQYSIEPGVFTRFCEKARTSVIGGLSTNLGLNKSPSIWKVSLDGTGENPVRTECMKNGHIRIGWDNYGETITDETDFSQDKGRVVLNAFINKMQIGDVVLSCFSASTIDAIGVISGEYEWHPEYDRLKRVRKVNWIVKGLQEDIREINRGAAMTLATVYRMSISLDDVLKILKKTGSSDIRVSPNQERYVFVIDEINRGNISKIFGELITLIEDTKRTGCEEEMNAILPYSGRPFSVPSNVFILGTMNTADRSIALMDTALRRRFSFIEMMPKADVLRDLGVGRVTVGNQELDVAAMLDVINERIEYLYDREHTIGHAFFTRLKDDPSVNTLASIFEKSVIPLLQEYFYEDYAKIQLVLGDDGKPKEYQFITDLETKPAELFNTVPDMDIPEKKYVIQRDAFFKIESYKKIGKGL